MVKISKRMKKSYEGFDKEKIFNLDEAVDFIIKNSSVKFDETFEMSVNTGLDPKYAEQNLRGVVPLPNGTGKTCIVAVFTNEDNFKSAKDAKADFVGSEELLDKVAKGTISFDVAVASPDFMPKMGKVARILGPKGLMPNPKLGTVTNDIAEAVKKAKAGQVEYRVEKNGIIHAGLGKLSFGKEKLLENIKAFTSVIVSSKPKDLKGTFLKSFSVSSSMGVGVRVDVADIIKK